VNSGEAFSAARSRNGTLKAVVPLKEQLVSVFRDFYRSIPEDGRFSILCHSDADGLCSGALLHRALAPLGRAAGITATRKGETPWSGEVISRLEAMKGDAILLCDLTPHFRPLLPGMPLLFVDHHRPQGLPPGAQLITGYGSEPTPSAGLITYWCVSAALSGKESDRWLAALSILGDLGEKSGFEELAAERALHGAGLLREATSLINAPRRSASGDATAALDLLLKAKGPRDVVQATGPEAIALKRAREEVQAALAEAKKAAPKFAGKMALIQVETPCQVHPLIAQIWKTRLPRYVVMCANLGYRPGYVHFSVRSATGLNLLDLLQAMKPPDVEEGYGGGHDQATGGALPLESWFELALKAGFDRSVLRVPSLRAS
jgi:single-stranded-DNA-specific exonuclease